MKLTRRSFMWVVAAVAVAMGAAVAFVLLASRDSAPPDMSAMAVTRLEVAQEENGWTYFVAATKALRPPQDAGLLDDFLTDATATPDDLAGVLADNARTFELLDQGLACPAFVLPEVKDIHSIPTGAREWSVALKLLAAKARACRLTGDHAQAAAACTALLRYGDLIARDAECVLHWIMGWGALSNGLDQTLVLAGEKTLPPQHLQQLASALARIQPVDAGLIRAAKKECLITCGTVDFLHGNQRSDEWEILLGENPGSWARRKVVRNYVFQPNKTKRLLVDHFSRVVADAPKAFADAEPPPPGVDRRGKPGKIGRLARPNALGRLLYEMTRSMDDVWAQRFLLEARLSGARVAVACHLFARNEGRHPENLRALVPTYLPAVPRDPFDGKEFRFLPATGMAYVVGPDLQDSAAAASGGNRDEGDDILFDTRHSNPEE